jgi:hypothetical protein
MIRGPLSLKRLCGTAGCALLCFAFAPLCHGEMALYGTCFTNDSLARTATGFTATLNNKAKFYEWTGSTVIFDGTTCFSPKKPNLFSGSNNAGQNSFTVPMFMGTPAKTIPAGGKMGVRMLRDDNSQLNSKSTNFTDAMGAIPQTDWGALNMRFLDPADPGEDIFLTNTSTDPLTITGVFVNLNNPQDPLDLSYNFDPAMGTPDSFNLVSGSYTISYGATTEFSFAFPGPTFNWSFGVTYTQDGSPYQQFVAADVPEPSFLCPMVFPLAGVLLAGQRRRSTRKRYA